MGASLRDQHEARRGLLGFKISAAVCAHTELPIAWRVETARAHESSLADDLLGRVKERVAAQTVTLDKGYDVGPVYEACERVGVLPVIPLRKTPDHCTRRAQAAEVRAWRVEVCGSRLQE